MQHKRLEHIPNVTFRHVAQLRKMNIHTTQQLLEVCSTVEERYRLAEKLEISELRVFDWVCAIDLFRISGLHSTYVTLLLEAGINSAEKIATQNAPELAAQLRELNQTNRIVRRLPNKRQIEGWIVAARQLPPLFEAPR